ncbi:unnamed protein product [Ceutorhynchus assimilis]|uniref:RRM domain-containing protein n=1 Tax=Ceutorhynchus assimilis TaxID=467358 RepID=A0A9P0DJZ3_9CUCU|nr:unnamed protein product [Ceutorhynchus assimilis]
MYSIFGSKSTKVKFLEEGEPPPKKQPTECDILIKKLTEKQLRTKTTLSEQVSQQQHFTQSAEFVDITGHICGKSTLKDFQTIIDNVDELNKLKNSQLFWDKYRDVNEDILKQRLQKIIQKVNCVHSRFNLSTNKPNPLDELANLEKDFMNTGTNYSKRDIKIIRKKARSLGNKINDLEKTEISATDFNIYKLNRVTLWDIKQKPPQKECVNVMNKNKKYSCDPQTIYTVRNGQIIKLNTNDDLEKNKKLTIAEIKKIPKFSMFEPGHPSNILLLKNLGKKVDKKSLERLLGNFKIGSFTIRIMNGKMKGQAFITFQNQVQATQGLEALNGVFIDGKPIIAQFGKVQECS